MALTTIRKPGSSAALPRSTPMSKPASSTSPTATAIGVSSVLDMATGAFKRGWGAYGIPLAEIANGPLPAFAVGQPPAKQFLGPVHCVSLSRDGLVYVCDRTSNRVQVFRKDGTFVKELFVRPNTLGNGSAWTVNFSADAGQRFLLVGDGRNNVIWLLNRETRSGRGHHRSQRT